MGNSMVKSGEPLADDLISLYEKADATINSKDFETARYYYSLAKNEIQSKCKEKDKDTHLLANELSFCKTYVLENKPKEAKKSAMKAMNIAKRLKDQMQIAVCMDFRSDIKRLEGKIDQAVDILSEALQIKLLAVGANHIQIANSYHKLGKIYTDQAKYQLALTLYKKSLEIVTKLTPGNSSEAAHLHHDIGTIYSSQKEHDKALEMYKIALGMNISLNNDPNTIAKSYWCLAVTFYRQSKYQESLKMHGNVLEVLAQKYEENNRLVARSYYHLGLIHYKLIDYQKALEMHEKALKIRTNIEKRNLRDIALSYEKLALTLDQLCRYSEAIDAMAKALNINIKLYGGKHIYIASNYNDMGMFYRHSSLYHQSRSMYEKAINILTDLKEECTDLIAIIRDNMAKIDNMPKRGSNSSRDNVVENGNSSSRNSTDDFLEVMDEPKIEANQIVMDHQEWEDSYCSMKPTGGNSPNITAYTYMSMRDSSTIENLDEANGEDNNL